MQSTAAVALLPRGDRFEDFHDTIGISLEDFCERLTGTWLFNYVEALQTAGIRPVLYFVSARVPHVTRITHRATGASICCLPSPWLHRKMQGAGDRLGISSRLYSSTLSYVATPWASLAREIRRDGCEAIVCQEYEYPRFDEAIVIGRALRIPVFGTFQGGDTPGSALELPFRRAAIRHAAGLLIGARTERQRVCSAYGVSTERTGLVPNAFDVRRWQPADRGLARAALGLPDGACVVVWHGRVEMDCKGLDILLDAWERLCAARRGVNPLLLLIGSGRDDARLGRRIASLPAATVRWQREYVLDRHLLWQYLSAADIAALPSRREGFPVTVIEAMACALPVIAADVSGVREALGEPPPGIIVPREDVRALVDAFQRLVDDEALRGTLGLLGRQRAEREFSLEAVGRQLRAFMEERGAFGGAHA